ncbi:TlpA disulfide reductase family protein [Spongiactinospora sp. TRM90649]|uniref:TlpA family protein disulfide reductase n=1 Tax=Spongiactinospora sp. TRM90649 TaxID=3031114 RepID=UPI0023F744FD|nr:TlpA disulfide reductase family protein [Spongiactinospora sp. TRM90649]MDF5757518.1 TlpA disulfide reductase family protein [Spongiactinospora sp. TRM90649]
MTVLVAAMVLLAVLCLFDLVLTFGVIRRLREHTGHLEFLLNGGVGADTVRAALPRPGSTVSEFEAVTTAGQTITRDFFTGPTVVAVFTNHCETCRERLPSFVEYAKNTHGSGVLVLLQAEEGHETTDAMLAELEAVGPVVLEITQGSLGRALNVSIFPAFCLIDAGGVIRAAEIALDDLPLAAARS